MTHEEGAIVPPALIPLFDAGRQLIKVRGVMLFSLACAALSMWAGVHLAQTYGLNPADGGVLAPLTVRLAWGIGVALLGVGFAAGMWLYGRCYVARIELDEETHQLHVYTVGFFGTARHVYDGTDIVGGHHHRGKLVTLWLSVNAPWRSIWIAGRRLPLIIDEQGEVLHKGWMSRLHLGRR
ncbi:MAG: hypothetical protein ACE5F6_01910 [Anaerolineae bacterium]